MKKETSLNLLEKIDVAKERIKELETMINHWERTEIDDFWDAECSINPSSPSCLLFNDWPLMDKPLNQISESPQIKNFADSLISDKEPTQGP